MNEIGLVLSWILQLVGLLLVLGSTALFWYKARTGKYRSVKREFIVQTGAQVGPDEKELMESDPDELIKKLKLPNLLYTNYRDSMIGVLFTLAGVILGAVTIFT